MSTLEQEIMDRFHQLDEAGKERIKTLIVHEREHREFDYEKWTRDIEEIREQIRADHDGHFPKIDVVTMLREIRDGEDDE